MLLDVSVLSPNEVLFEGKAKSVILPGEDGVFEVLPFHKRIVSRLVSGTVIVDDREIRVERGIAKMDQNVLTVIVEES